TNFPWEEIPMTARTWIRNLFARTPRTIRKASARCRPRLEALEDRLTPSGFVYQVTGTSDNTNPVITTPANGSPAGSLTDPYLAPSLRSATHAANLDGQADTIEFAPAIAGQIITLTMADPTTTQASTSMGGSPFGPSALVVSGNISIAGTGETI